MAAPNKPAAPAKGAPAKGGKGKKVVTTVKLQIPGGNATPAPPVGPALGQHGVNIMEQTVQRADTAAGGHRDPRVARLLRPLVRFHYPGLPASILKQAAGLAKGSGEPNRNKVGKVTMSQVRKIAETKMPDLNAVDVDAAARMVAGTARSMGIVVEE
jgi:large subunit ribosomal protein L11